MTMSDIRSNLSKLRGGVDQATETTQAIEEAEVIVGAYERISDDQESEDTGDRGAGVRRQKTSNAELAKLLGWKIHRHYPDNDVSAYKKVVRPAFEDLLADLKDGVIDGIVVYDLDRLARRSDDLERVIEIYDAARAAGREMVFSSAHDAINLSSPDGITLARVMIAFANKASRDTARRVAAQRRAIALTGAPVGGTRPFGWDWHRDATAQPDGAVEHGKRTHVVNAVEAAEIRRLADELLDGARINDLVRDLNVRGVTTPRGNQWKAQTLKQMLLSPRLAGLRVHQGQVLIDPATKEWVRGQWEPILDDDTWMAVAEHLSNVAGEQEPRAEPHRSYLLSGILRCSQCNGPLHGNARSAEHWYYACKARGGGHGKVGCGKISASGQAVDHLVERLMRERMRTTQVEYATKTAWEKEGELTEIKKKIRQLLQTFSNASGEAAEQALAEVARLNDEAEKLRIERGEWLRARGGRRAQARLSRSSWDDLSLDERRAYVRAELESIYVMPSTKRGNRFDPERLVPVWRET